MGKFFRANSPRSHPVAGVRNVPAAPLLLLHKLFYPARVEDKLTFKLAATGLKGDIMGLPLLTGVGKQMGSYLADGLFHGLE